ncbi:hypothetical protein [Variovorax sp.]|uniref:hypothetical protein n=1 Tax=Variovorax sp. TaxID=1871043 RepID=UPI002D69B400|nr:hypothetical protein [Variovorax sp.]HYP85671.1 hypothetical protein [Variovorax sp.]
MSAADFLLAPEVQKLLKVVLAEPAGEFTVGELARRTKLDAADVERTQAHLVTSGILTERAGEDGESMAVCANRSFVFYDELRAIALKSFAAAEPIRAMLRSRFKASVVRAFILGEDEEGTVELLVVHGELVPDKADMSAACQKLSASIGRHLKVHVISSNTHARLGSRDGLGFKLNSGRAFEIIAQGQTKAKPQLRREGFLQSARKRLWA